MRLACGIEADDLEVLVHDLQASADMEGRRAQHATALKHRKLGGAAADVDVEHTLAGLERHIGRARAIAREHGFHVMASRRTDEFAASFRKQLGNALRIFTPQGLACENNGTGIDFRRLQAGTCIGVLDDLAEFHVVDAGFAGIGRQRDGGEIESLARDNIIAAGQVFSEAAQVNAREDDLRARRADVDTNAGEMNIVGQPERVFLDRPVHVEFVVIMVGIAVVFMRPARTHAMMFGHFMSGLVIVIIRGHASSSLVSSKHTCRASLGGQSSPAWRGECRVPWRTGACVPVARDLLFFHHPFD